jgi:hypothetical protein
MYILNLPKGFQFTPTLINFTNVCNQQFIGRLLNNMTVLREAPFLVNKLSIEIEFLLIFSLLINNRANIVVIYIQTSDPLDLIHGYCLLLNFDY